MKVRMLQDRSQRISSGRSRDYRKDEIYTVRQAVGRCWMDEGIAEAVAAPVNEAGAEKE